MTPTAFSFLTANGPSAGRQRHCMVMERTMGGNLTCLDKNGSRDPRRSEVAALRVTTLCFLGQRR